jgi:SAM-dependent methyltransferase
VERERQAGFDRYKASSFRAYNEKLPGRYDRSVAVRVLHPERLDEFVLGALGDRLGDLSVLDVGCATGRLLERLAEAGARRIAGADLAPRIVEVARRKLSRFDLDADLRSADAEDALPWPDDAFDVVVSTGVIHHLTAPERALAEMKRVLHQDGSVVIADACFFPPVREFFNLCLRVHPHEGDHYFRTAEQMRKLLTACGWRVRSCERINWWAFGVVASTQDAACRSGSVFRADDFRGGPR